MKSSVSDRYFTGLIWVFLDKAGNGGINFIITIILARLLSPNDFGLVAMVLIFYELSSTFVESGFSTALIRMKNISEVDKSTTFVFNFVASIVIYILLFLFSPLIAKFFNEPQLIPIVRVMSVNLIIGSFAIIQRAQLSHAIDFKTQAKVRLFAVLVAGVTAVVFALLNFGVWSLVVKYGLTTLMYSILLCYFNRWVPSFNFDYNSFRKLFSFGSKILLTAFINKFFLHIYNILIGRFFTTAILGLYSQANHLKNLVIFTFFHTIDRVSYVALAKIKDDKDRLKKGYRKILKMTSFLIIPVLITLVVMSDIVIMTLLGSKWLEAAPYLQILCLSGLTYHLSQINLNVLLVIGRPDLNLRLEIYKKIMIVIAISIGIRYGIFGLLISELCTSYLALIFNAYYSKRFLKYTFQEQIMDILATTIFSLLAAFVVFQFLNIIYLGDILKLVFGFVIAASIYLGLHYIFKTEEFNLLVKTVIPRTLKLIGTPHNI